VSTIVPTEEPTLPEKGRTGRVGHGMPAPEDPSVQPQPQPRQDSQIHTIQSGAVSKPGWFFWTLLLVQPEIGMRNF